ncbi:MAG: peptide chain release factor-like protein [Deltaproteobacteria bacterium]|nr:MAG: peptide chain release factor-like protein [Deltaproteobacteria bacterium]
MIFPVSPEKQKQLEEKMLRFGVREEDLLEDFIKGSGSGGQKINKTSVVVFLKHIPTGLIVRCQESRSQAMNRFLARRLLVEKIESQVLGKQSQEEQAREKIRRQKRKRSKRAKAKMLDDKRHHANKKALRSRRLDD